MFFEVSKMDEKHRVIILAPPHMFKNDGAAMPPLECNSMTKSVNKILHSQNIIFFIK